MTAMAKEKKSIGKKIGSIVASAVIIILVLLIGVTVYSKITGNMIIPYSVMWVRSGSMEPTIPTQSYILVKKASAEDIKVGDVICFTSRDPKLNGEKNTHRVVEIIGNNDEFVTRGDAAIKDDDFHVYKSDIVAKYVRNLKFLTFFGKVYSTIASFAGRVYSTTAGFMITMVLLLIIAVIWSKIVMRDMKKQEEKAESDEIEKLIAEEVERLKAADAAKETNPEAETSENEKE